MVFTSTKIVIFSKFECSYARQLLPCFDDPNIRATYRVKIIIPKELTGISNMPIDKVNIIDNEEELEFLPTPPMCSYLLCICVGDFGFIEGETKFCTKVKFYTSKGKGETLPKYLRVAIFSLEWLEEELNAKYELPHLQLITYKGYKIGMENYGLITLCDYKDGTVFLRHSKVVMHEIAHKWFGDLASIEWCYSVWLNEGFAQFFQFFILNDCDPNFNGRGVSHFVEGNGFRCLRFFDKDKVVLFPIVYEKNGKLERLNIFVKDKVTKIDIEFDWIVINDDLGSLCCHLHL